MQGMRIGVGLGFTSPVESLDDALARFREAEAAGFHTAWVPNIFSRDALTLIALGGRETSTIELGTAVVPTFSRHPFYMAQQAATTQEATRGRLVLGLGPSHKVVVEDLLGLSFEKPARHVREYLTVLRALLDTGRVSFEGETYRVNAQLERPEALRIPVLIGGLGKVMRGIAGSLADGTITWMTGPKTLGDTLVPAIAKAAAQAGRKAPRIVCGLPIALTDDPAGAREAMSKAMSIYGTLPSYRAMLDIEGVTSPGDIAIAGDRREIERSLRTLADAGVTDFNAAIFGFGSDRAAAAARTYELLAQLARG
ncbi:MAG: TIGR03564 family F420-dependent LLM class oxidoreductase [Deltaproteobacteria bacterium]|nr:MAG: TIGR03564 family F420-dependent LLM class oxidoreductase [Deltaproteobacteria bacterium]